MGPIPEVDSRRFARSAALGACLAALGLAAMFARSPNFDPPAGADARAYGGDFVQEYAAGRVLRDGDAARLYETGHLAAVEHDPAVVGFTWNADLYFPAVYPPFYYLAVSPLSALDYPVALAAWLVFLAACGLGSVAWLIARSPFWRRRAVWALPAAVLFLPFAESLVSAQKGTVLLALFTATFALLERRRSFAAGAVFAGVAFKPQLGLVLAFAMVLERDARFVAGAAATGLVLLGLSFAADPALPFAWVRALADATPQLDPELLRRSHSGLGQVRLILGSWAGPAVVGAWALFAGATLAALAALLRAARAPADLPLRFSAIVLATVLVSPHLYGYDLTLLLIPQLLLVGDASDATRRARAGWALALFAVCAVSTRIASVVPIQSSTWAMLGCLVYLAREARRAANVRP